MYIIDSDNENSYFKGMHISVRPKDFAQNKEHNPVFVLVGKQIFSNLALTSVKSNLSYVCTYSFSNMTNDNIQLGTLHGQYHIKNRNNTPIPFIFKTKNLWVNFNL